MSKFNTTSAKASLKQMANDAKRPLAIIGGLIVGTQVARFLNKNVSPSVSGLLGLDGMDAKKIVTPVLLATAGIAGQQFVKNQLVKDLLTGVAISGGAILVNEISKKKIVALGDVDGVDGEHIALPGIGSDEPRRALPGIGEPELPSLDDFRGTDGTDGVEGTDGFEGLDNIEDAQVVSIDGLEGENEVE